MRPQPNRLPTRLGVAAAAFLIAGAALPAAATADPISSVVVFGDSSSDLGSQGLARRPTNLGQMWSERLAGNLGLTSTLAREFQITPAGELKILKPGGANYAVNGSTVLDFDCCISLSQQIDFFVEDRKRFKGDELVFLYFDRNDVETAFGDGLPYSASAFADEYIKQVKRLKALGARNIFAVGWEL
ncbi:MAG: hypothetical protein KAG62_16235, partial [Caulobacter sp.]|nr:hypothetical protein [Caulobacter sp.]